MNYRGTKWYKCDFHLHTPASKCFLDKEVSPEQWVKACIEVGLQCVAVTDHNTGEWIDKIKAAAIDTSLTIFPGVEITCDTSKIHLLVLFEKDKNTRDIEDFLIACGISRESFASSEAHSTMSVLDIAKKANETGAVVIPAHIDEFNGLAYHASSSSLKDFLDLPFINSVQFVHSEYLSPTLQITNNRTLVDSINSYYGKPTPAIGEIDIKNAYNGVQTAIKSNKKLLTFSDNPDSTQPAKHGLSGIGKNYTWIKMDENPTLESIRQAFLMPDRTKHSFESIYSPYKTPNLWIRKIKISNTSLTKKDESFEVEFSPQLTTIIGGRGSGKSSILQFLRGVFSKEKDLEGLDDVKTEYKRFFRNTDGEGLGVLNNQSKIEVYFVRDSIEYRITYTNESHQTCVEKFNIETSNYETISDDSFIDFFAFEEYSQKQIFSIAKKTNSLRNRIDNAVLEIEEVRKSYLQKIQEYKSLMETQRALIQSLQNKGKLNTEITDLKSKIELLKQSGIADIISKQQTFIRQKRAIDDYLQEFQSILGTLENNIELSEKEPNFDESLLEEQYRQNVKRILQQPALQLLQINIWLKSKTKDLEQTLSGIKDLLENTDLYKNANSCTQQFEIRKAELEKKGVTDMSDFEKYNQLIAQKESELKILLSKEKELAQIKSNIGAKIHEIEQLRNYISEKRKEFVESYINSEKIKVSIRPYFDQFDFVSKFRKIIQKQSGYDSGIEKIENEVFGNNDVLTNLKELKKRLHAIHESDCESSYDGWFTKLIKDLTPSQLDDIECLYHEDKVEMQYKGANGNFRSLSLASAGQKTTSILTFILSFGNVPLILDQPEDDLDNRLVYELIVDKIRQIKEARQVIIVTHNANIPVNGDAEYVISLASNSKNIKIEAEGSLEKEIIKHEICEIMEGGEEAFKTRAKRYASIGRKS